MTWGRAKLLSRRLADRRGVAAIEMAFVLPILVVMLFGIVEYGSWLALAQVVQQGANEAARAAIGGLAPEERAAVARATAQRTLARTYAVPDRDISVGIDDDGETLTVAVTYDASHNPLLSMPLVPRPEVMIRRTSSVRIALL